MDERDPASFYAELLVSESDEKKVRELISDLVLRELHGSELDTEIQYENRVRYWEDERLDVHR